MSNAGAHWMYVDVNLVFFFVDDITSVICLLPCNQRRWHSICNLICFCMANCDIFAAVANVAMCI